MSSVENSAQLQGAAGTSEFSDFSSLLQKEFKPKSEKAKDQLELWINKRVEDRIDQFNLATKDEVADLRRKVEELQVALNKDSGK